MIGNGFPIQPVEWQTFPLTPAVFAELATGLKTVDIEIVQQEPRQVLLGIAMCLEEAWVGAGASSLIVSVGTSSDPDLYALGWEQLGFIRSAESFQIASMFGMQSLDEREPVIVQVTSDLDLDDFTAGRLSVSAMLGRVP